MWCRREDVLCDRSRSTWWFDRDYASEELPVTQGCAAGAINSNHVLVELSDLRYHSSPIPFEGVVADLVLNSNGVSPQLDGRRPTWPETVWFRDLVCCDTAT